jgi:hypothetical protein
MPAYHVTVTATFTKTQAKLDAETVTEAKNKIENASFTVPQATANSEATLKSWLVAQINSLLTSTGLTITESNITISNFTAASGGANGSFDLTITLTKGGSTVTATKNSNTITATTIATYTVTIGTTANGSVTSNRTSSIAQGETVTLTITPAAGYELTSIAAHKTGEPATVVTLSGTGATRSFSMPAFDVTITAVFSKTQATLDAETVVAVKAAIEGGIYRVAQATANNAASIKTWLINTLKVLFGQSFDIQLRSAPQPMIGDVTVSNVIPALAGTEATPNGIDGSYNFTVTLTSGATTLTTTVTDGVIIATPHSATPVKRIELLPFGDLTVRVLNTGNTATGDLTAALTGANAGVFTLPAANIGSLAAGNETYILLTPLNNLPIGTYKATLTVSGDGLTTQSVEITYTVTATGADNPNLKPLSAYILNGTMYVSGLLTGEKWSVYNMAGVLIHQAIAIDENAKVILSTRGVYLVTSGNQIVKVLY